MITNSRTLISKSFEYKAKIVGRTTPDNKRCRSNRWK